MFRMFEAFIAVAGRLLLSTRRATEAGRVSAKADQTTTPSTLELPVSMLVVIPWPAVHLTTLIIMC